MTTQRNTYEDSGLRACRGCDRLLPLADFYPSLIAKRQFTCRECCKSQTRAWRQANPERARALQNKWRSANRDLVAAYDRKQHLKRTYGITVEEYDGMLAAQGGKCAACGSTESGKKRYNRFQVDHDHQTGAKRGLLCLSCNVALGQVNDSVDRLMGLAAYLMANRDVLSESLEEA